MLTLLIVMTGIMAGVYFSFSVFVMKALAELPEQEGARAMNKINDVIVNTLFLPLFFISSLWHLGLAVWAIAHWQGAQSLLLIASAILYIGGMFAITAFGNVPLNNRLKESSNNPKELANCWRKYLRSWHGLNHIRSVSCIFSLSLMVIAVSNGTSI